MAIVFPPGTLLNNNRYEIIRVLSQKGGMGLVYLARDHQTNQQVAIKRNKEMTPEGMDQFRREAAMVRPLRHPNLVRVENYFEEQGGQFVVMEFIPGEDLEEIANRAGQPLDEDRVIEWGKTLCKVLTYLHAQADPIIHRDIKPANVKIKPDSALVLVDFGIAKAHRPGQKTVLGAKAATAGYAPFEQYGTGTDQRTDIYSLGATLYFLLTQMVPLEAPIRLTNPGLFPRQLNPRLSPAMSDVLCKALQVQQADRYQTANEMLAALQVAQQVRQITTPPPSTKACPSCHGVNRGNAVFCFSCGKQLPNVIACPNCGTAVRANARFCHACRYPLTTAPASMPPPALTVACLRCGTPNRTHARFCVKCGALIISAPVVPPMPQPPISIPPPIFTPPAPVLPLTAGQCPSCGYTNPPTENFCQQCGYQLARPTAPPPLPPIAPSHKPTVPPVPIGPLPEQKTVGGILFAVGALAMVFGIWQSFTNGTLIVTIPLILLGLFTAVAGRDLTDWFAAARGDALFWLAWMFGDALRGRRWGAITATLWIILGVATAWLIMPLAIAGVMAFVLHTLVSERFAQALSVRSTRPGWVIVIGWLLTFSGIGTVPGIALLIPKSWAKITGVMALGAWMFIALIGLGWALVFAGAPASAFPVNWITPVFGVNVIVASVFTTSSAIILGALAAIRYLASVTLKPATSTARHRELNVAGWTQLGAGIATMSAAFVWINGIAWNEVIFWSVLADGALALIAARDVLELGNGALTGLPLIVGSRTRGRRLGVIAAAGLAIFAALFLWLAIPAVFLIIAIFLLRELMSHEALAECGETPHAPSGVTLIGWALLPTGIGTFQAIQVLRGEKAGWQWTAPTLALIVPAGFTFAGWALLGGGQTAPTNVYVTGALVSFGIVSAISSALAFVYWNMRHVRQYFRV